MLGPPAVTFGSAHLFGARSPRAARGGASDAEEHARRLLHAALEAGATRLDTAPSYGHGRSEAVVAQVAAAGGVPVTTKVGLEPVPVPGRAKLAVGSVLRSLPPPAERAARRALRGGAAAPSLHGGGGAAPSGRFATGAVRASVERSLRRAAPAGRLDRLLLHEVAPGDLTDDLLDLLRGLRASGDVRELGVATANHLTAACVEREPDLLAVAHVSAAVSGPGVPAVPAGTHVVGHGLLGAAGRDLALARGRASAAGLAPSDDQLVVALARRAAAALPEVLVATSRPDRVALLVQGLARPDDDDAARSLTHALSDIGSRATQE